jgi:hypothetical protein
MLAFDINLLDEVQISVKQSMRFQVPLIWQNLSRIDKAIRHMVKENGLLKRQAHGYPVFYIVDAKHGPLTFQMCFCHDCASHVAESNFSDIYNLRVIAYQPNWEDKRLRCEDCDQKINFAYK